MRLDEIAYVRSGMARTDGSSSAWFVQVGDITSEGLDTARLSEGFLPARSPDKVRLLTGDVVIAMRGNENAAAVVKSEEIEGRFLLAALEVGVVRLTGDLLLPDYLAAYVNLPKTQRALSAERLGAGAPRLPISGLRNLEIPVPNKTRQRTIADLANAIGQEESLQNQIRETRKRFFDGLLAHVAEEPVSGSHPTRAHRCS